MQSPTKQSLASPQLQALLMRAEAALAQPENKTPGQLAAAERVKRAVIARSSRLTQGSNPSSPASRGLPQSNVADVSELPSTPPSTADRPEQSEKFQGSRPKGAVSGNMSLEAAWNTRRKAFVAGVMLLSIPLIIGGPIGQGDDAEAQLGLLLYGPLIAGLVAAVAIMIFDVSVNADLRRGAAAKFLENPIRVGIGIAWFAVTLSFLGLMLLSGIGLGPEKSNMFLILIAASVALGLLQSRVR